MANPGFTSAAIAKAREARRNNIAARREAERQAESREARQLAAAERAHKRDPRVKLYRAELPAFRRREAKRIEEAQATFARLMALEEQRRKGGRPPSRTGKNRGPSLDLLSASEA